MEDAYIEPGVARAGADARQMRVGLVRLGDDARGRPPYGALGQALRALVRQLLAERDDRLRDWRQRLSAPGANGQVLVDLIPELEQVVGPQPPVPT